MDTFPGLMENLKIKKYWQLELREQLSKEQ